MSRRQGTLSAHRTAKESFPLLHQPTLLEPAGSPPPAPNQMIEKGSVRIGMLNKESGSSPRSVNPPLPAGPLSPLPY